ncbi:MAG: RNA polymerase sigma-70 factor [Bacteroidota bacterium]
MNIQNLSNIALNRSLLRFMANGSNAKLEFEQFFKENYPLAVSFAVKFVKDLDTAREIAQQAFVNLYEKKDQLEIKTSFKAYLMQSVRNRCLNHFSRQQTIQKHHKAILDSSRESLDHQDQLEYSEFEHKVFGVINSLPEKCQKIFKMNRFEGKKNQEIADELGISKRTVETQISKALKILRKEIRVNSA